MVGNAIATHASTLKPTSQTTLSMASNIMDLLKGLFVSNSKENNNFKEDLAMSESSNRSDVINNEGFMGKYQFGDDRLTDYRNETGLEFNRDEFLNNESLQDQVFDWHVSDISKYIDNKDLNKYIGKTINGIEITKQGLIAGAHLGGRYGMRQFLESNGKKDPADKNKTKISDYIKKFST